MRYTVEGADAQSGRDVVITVEATSPKVVEKIAHEQGILISSIHTSKVQNEVGKIDLAIEEAAEAAENDDIGFTPPAAVPAVPSHVPYAGPRTASGGIPDYTGLRIGATVLFVSALLYYAAGILLFVGAIVGFLIQVIRAGSGSTAMIGVVPVILLGIGALMCGGLFQALSAACVALRDIARNSFNH
jgi:hypothetical protein